MMMITLGFIVAIISLLSNRADAQAFTKTGGECHEGFSEPNCPRVWRISGGPGWVDQRAAYENVQTICSPSCNDNSSPKVCSLILALHGIYSNPNDQKWLMIGTGQDAETYAEDEAHGGPFCISFHKSKDYAWEYACDGDDEAHLKGFIEYAIDNFPIDPNAVNVHGFSSGGIQIHNMMRTQCAIESLISVASTYGSGNVPAPPSTKAAYLIVHGTHDNVVPYDMLYDNGDKPSCDCNTDLGGPNGSCSGGSGLLSLFGERLAAAIATMRGYTGDVWGPSLTRTSQMDLMERDVGRCNNVLSACIDRRPNPPSYSCDDLEEMETDVIEYPLPSNSNAGPVTVWRINMQNHDYPNKRRNPWGATEFFLQLRKFFNDNRGRRSYAVTRDIVETGTGYVCSNPPLPWDTTSPYGEIYRWPLYSQDYSKEECRIACLKEKRCHEAFYVDTRNYGGSRVCMIHYDLLPCSQYSDAWWFDPVHWTATTIASPTGAPTSAPIAGPITPTSAPIPAVTLAPAPTSIQMCSDPQALVPSNNAGYACLVNDASVADSNAGATEASCNDDGGVWTPYDCQTADGYLQLQTDPGLIDMFIDWWRPKCCLTPNPAPAPAPTPSLAPGCPIECTVPNCVWLGTDGPGWDPTWSRDEDGTPTINGFCTNYCAEYEPGKALCGDGAWHQSGVDCTGCASLALDPIVDPSVRSPSSGLCAEVEGMSGHALWGTGIKQCLDGPQPSSDAVCTIHQSFNGDAVVSPGRTCDSFCSHFGLSCLNGYDDGENRCLYGGEGIGCHDVLGTGSVGGPTPDHVCVCTVAPPTPAPVITCADRKGRWRINGSDKERNWCKFAAKKKTERRCNKFDLKADCPITCNDC